MKIMMILLLVLSVNAQAASVTFLSDSKIPSALQAKINAAVAKACPATFSITEVETSVEAVAVDQGIVDSRFDTELNGYYLTDGAHPIASRIFVKSIDASGSISNPRFENMWIESLDASDCK